MAVGSNVHECQHPVLKSKISQLRSSQLKSARDTRGLVSEMSSIIAVEASASAFSTICGAKETSMLGFEYTTVVNTPGRYALIPVLRSGLSMLDSFQRLLPDADVPVYHLGIFRDKSTLAPVEYYNKLPNDTTVDLAIVIDPIIATGGTAEAVIQTLKEWNTKRIIFCSLIGYEGGVGRVAAEHPDVDFYIGQIDSQLSESGFIIPGIGDVGDRLHSTSLA